MRMFDIIASKRDGGELTREQIDFFVYGSASGDIPDYQITALLMAVYLNGMTERETLWLTDAMAHSGDMTDLSEFGDATVDKHSTGGVGDKTTLIIAPVAAALGCVVAKISGRGLGHTGGTVDKFESIPGFRTSLSAEEFRCQVRKTGICVVGQSGNMVPADKKFYALRDTTATIGSLPLIASSVMCKKIASGSKSIVLDVTVGSGAFMKTKKDARTLADMMVTLGKNAGRRVSALITDMDEPLGYYVGNSLEVSEALCVLRGEIQSGHLYDVCVALASHMASLALKKDLNECENDVKRVLSDGSALEKLALMVRAQGGDDAYIYGTKHFADAKYGMDIKATSDGFISRIDALGTGRTAMLLGAGRDKKTDVIDSTAGVVLRHRSGDKVKRGDVVATLFSGREELFENAKNEFLASLCISDTKPTERNVVHDVVR